MREPRVCVHCRPSPRMPPHHSLTAVSTDVRPAQPPTPSVTLTTPRCTNHPMLGASFMLTSPDRLCERTIPVFNTYSCSWTITR
eukprot:2126386-Pleurochrysis_carterae.AAC.1